MSESKLSSAFRNLLALSKHQIAVDTPQISNARLPKIADAIQVDRIQAKPKVDLHLIYRWREAIKLNAVDHVSSRELRKLSWEPEIALTDEFLTEIKSRNLPLGRSLLKGLVYTLLTAWDEPQAKKILRLIKDASKVDSTSPYLKKVAPYILSENGHAAAANALIAKRSSVQKTLSEIFGIALSTTKYAQAVFEVVIEVGHQKVLSGDVSERRWFYSEVLQHVSKGVLLVCLDRVVTAIDQNKNEAAKEEFKHFVLFHPNLGDPRLPGYEGNWPKEKPITAKVIEWLSQSDIKFFFELFIEKQADRQGRKQFWLKYAHLVKGTRVIVSQHDQRRLARQISEMKQKSGTSNLFADLLGTSEATVFMMDFGRVIVVEFSLENNACYYYANPGQFKYSDRIAFWRTDKFSISELKDKRGCKSPLTHRDGWEANFTNILAGFGLRPKIERRGY